MGLFKTEEEKREKEKEKIREWEEIIRDKNRYDGRVRHIHQGLSTFGLWGVRDNGKTKFKSTRFEFHDDKLLIERNKQIIQLSQIKEIFEDTSLHNEIILILNNDTGIPIRGKNYSNGGRRKFKAFVNVLNKLIEDNKSNIVNSGANTNPEDKIDKIIKLGEMYDKGLLTDDEFASMKQEIMSWGNDDSTESCEENVELLEDSCENCGADISPDDAFCSECGTKLN